MRALAMILILAIWAPAVAGEHSGVTPLSEDELLDAYISGEIDYDQYVLLLDALQDGVDTRALNLYELGMLSIMAPRDSSLVPEESPSTTPNEKRPGHSAVDTRYSYYRRLEASEQTRYRMQLKAKVNSNWEFGVQVRKELSGRERFVGRSVVYRSRSGWLEQLEAGTFVRRFGLGTVIGYRGKLFPRSSQLGAESFLYPDYGGFNGLATDFRLGKYAAAGVWSVGRSTDYSMAVGALTVSRTIHALKFGVTIGVARLTNRQADRAHNDLKAAVTLEHRPRHGYTALEYCYQAGDRVEPLALVGETRQQIGTNRVQAAAWTYGRDYLNLSGAPRSSSLSHRVWVDELDFEFTDRRTGQRGLLMKTVSGLSGGLDLELAVLGGWFNTDSSLAQFDGELKRSFNSRWRIGVAYQAKHFKRNVWDSLQHRVRVTVRYTSRGYSFTQALGPVVTENGDHWSWLADFRVRVTELTSMQVWSNVAKILTGRVEYWSLTAKIDQQVWNGLAIASKALHRYDRNATDRHQLAFSVEVESSI